MIWTSSAKRSAARAAVRAAEVARRGCARRDGLEGGIGTVNIPQMALEVSFTALVISLASSAAVHFGDLGDPMSGDKQPVNLPAAAQTIELLAILEDKTRGNLTDEEQQVLTQVLAELRLRYVELAKAAK